MEFLKWGAIKRNELKGNCKFFLIDIAWGLHKLGIILERKVSPNLKFN